MLLRIFTYSNTEKLLLIYNNYVFLIKPLLVSTYPF